MTTQLPENYQQTYQEIKQIVKQAQYRAFKAVNTQLIDMYWQVGKLISPIVAESNWGDDVYTQLEKDLAKHYPGLAGFSSRNIRRMVDFYTFDPEQKLFSVTDGRISWTNIFTILETSKPHEEKLFYIQKAAQHQWSSRVLREKLKQDEYKQLKDNQTNFTESLAIERLDDALGAVKDNYNLDFLDLSDKHKERELEDSISTNIVAFLSQMDGYFTFAGRQVKVTLDDNEYFIDLLFYHRKLKCLVVVELKVGEFIPDYAGKMSFYVNLIDNTMKLPEEQPTIGIIICGEKNRTVVEYTLKDTKRPIGVATYSYKELPKEMAQFLPSEQDLQDILKQD